MIYSFRIGSLINEIGFLRKISIIAGILAALILLWLAAFTENDLDKAFLQISIMLCAALILGYGARRLRQPPVLGEILAGITLGPTVLGFFLPGVQSWLIPSSGLSRQIVLTFAYLGLISFVFISGLEVDLDQVMRRRRAIILTSAFGIIIPFFMGSLSVILFPDIWRPSGNLALFAVIAGATLSISALPVIARILMDLNLAGREVGSTILASATIDDAIGWVIFAFVLSTTGSGISRNLSMGLTTGFFALAVLAIYLRFRCQIQGRCNRILVGSTVEIASAIMLSTAVISEAMGAHGIFGAFLAGMVLCEKRKRKYFLQKTRPLIMGLLAPVYFASIGLKANFVEGFDLTLVLLVLLVACLGKISGASLGARLSGMSSRDALAVGFGMNARGAVEIVLASLALENHLVDQRIFVALVTMALVTTMLSGTTIQKLAGASLSGDKSLAKSLP
jgi:Kef-type K+ transport system membrane component KefB